MKSKVTQLSTYDETNSTWRQPIDIGAKAVNVDLDIGNGSVRNIQGAIGEYTDSESIAEKIGHLDRTMDYDDWLLLSEEEKNSGDWYIPDFPVSGTVVPIGPLEDMVGATGSIAGVHGLVPAPAAGDNEKFLRGDGTWGNPHTIGVVLAESTGEKTILQHLTALYSAWTSLSKEEKQKCAVIIGNDVYKCLVTHNNGSFGKTAVTSNKAYIYHFGYASGTPYSRYCEITTSSVSFVDNTAETYDGTVKLVYDI